MRRRQYLAGVGAGLLGVTAECQSRTCPNIEVQTGLDYALRAVDAVLEGTPVPLRGRHGVPRPDVLAR